MSVIKDKILYRERVLARQGNIWDKKLTREELDLHRPSTPSSMAPGAFRAWCVSDCEKRVSKLRFHSHWGRACQKP